MNEITTVITPETIAALFGEGRIEIPLLSKLFDFEQLVKREIYLGAEIDVKDGEDVASIIRRYNYDDDKNQIPIEERTPIKIYIDCYGGVVSAGMSMIDSILLSKTPVHTIVTGVAYSMAGLLLMSGHKRFAYPSATFLLHDGSIGIMGDASKARDHMDFNTKYSNEIVKPFILKHTKISLDEYEKNLRVEWFMIAEEMLKYGIVDEISMDV